jgi:hypothetical protein
MLLKDDKLQAYAGLLNNEAPENHFLAYITPGERDMLVEAGGVKTPTESGIFAYPPGEKYGGTNSSGGFNDPTPSSGGSSNNNNNNNNNNNSGNGGDGGDAREQYSVKQTSTGFVKGGGDVTFLGGDSNDPSNYAVSDAIVDSAVTQKEQEKYAEQFGGVAPLGSRPVGFNTKAEYNQMTYIAGSQLDSIKAKLKQAGFTDFNKDATLSEMKDYVKTLNRTGKINDSWKNSKDTKGNPLYSPETIAEWESLGYIPQSVTGKSPGLFGKVMELASPSGTLGAPLSYDQLLADFDTITKVGQSKGMGFQERMKTFQPERYAAENGLLYNGKTKTFTSKGGGNEQDAFTRSNAPYQVGQTAPQESMVGNYFANLNNTNLGISQDYLNTYNAAKTKMANTLNMTPPNQQYGYTNTYNDTYARKMNNTNVFYNYLNEQGLI